MEILLSKKMGFCFGVRKSIDLANKTIIRYKNNIHMLGPIIHNPRVVEDFQKRGVGLINNIEKAPDESVVITRAHGISPSVGKMARIKKIKLIDTTCSNVKKLQEIATYLYRKSYSLLIFGDKKHPEILSVLDMVDNNAIVINDINDIINIKINKKIGFISQTTKNLFDFKKIACLILDKAKELRIYNTICPATMERQKSASELSRKVNIMLVIGGKNSANTTRLAKLCKSQGVKTYYIESKHQLIREWFSKYDKVGITSGASTPDYLTNEIIKKLEDWFFKQPS